MRDQSSDSAMDRAQGPMYGMEHSLAWLMAAVAIVLGALGLLVGFNILDLRSGEVGIGGGADATGLPASFLDGTMLIFAGITAGILAFTLHSTDHHRMRNPSTLEKKDQAMMSTEHMGAYLAAAGSVALVIIGLAVGYGVFSTDNSQLDAMLWIWSGFGAGILAATLHAVRHHVTETDEIVAIVTERVRTDGPVVQEPRTRPTR